MSAAHKPRQLGSRQDRRGSRRARAHEQKVGESHLFRKGSRRARAHEPRGIERCTAGELLAVAHVLHPGIGAQALELAAALRTLEAEAADLVPGLLALLADAQHQPGGLETLQVPAPWAGEIERAADVVRCSRVWSLGREVRHVVGLLALAVATASRRSTKGGQA